MSIAWILVWIDVALVYHDYLDVAMIDVAWPSWDLGNVQASHIGWYRVFAICTRTLSSSKCICMRYAGPGATQALLWERGFS